MDDSRRPQPTAGVEHLGPVVVTVEFPNGRSRTIRLGVGDHVRVWLEGNTAHIEQTTEFKR